MTSSTSAPTRHAPTSHASARRARPPRPSSLDDVVVDDGKRASVSRPSRARRVVITIVASAPTESNRIESTRFRFRFDARAPSRRPTESTAFSRVLDDGPTASLARSRASTRADARDGRCDRNTHRIRGGGGSTKGHDSSIETDPSRTPRSTIM